MATNIWSIHIFEVVDFYSAAFLALNYTRNFVSIAPALALQHQMDTGIVLQIHFKSTCRHETLDAEHLPAN